MLGQRRSRTYEFEDFYVINIKGRWERGGGGGGTLGKDTSESLLSMPL